MRATLEELKAMSPDQLEGYWTKGKFPFDFMNGCGNCLLEHAQSRHNGKCHPEIKHLTKPIYDQLPTYAYLHGVLEELYALRLFYDSLYPPAPAAEPVVAEAEEAVRA